MKTATSLLFLSLLMAPVALNAATAPTADLTTGAELTNGDYIIINKKVGTEEHTRKAPTSEVLLLQGIVDVKSFGATGDGVTDDTAAIQAAIDKRSGTNQTFYFPPGTYKMTAPLKIRRENTRLLGAGPDRTTISQATAGQHGIVLEPATGNWGGVTTMLNTVIEGITIVGLGRGTTDAAGIYLGSLTSPGDFMANMVKIQRVRVGNSGTTGFRFGLCVSNAVSVVAELCEFKYCTEAIRLARSDSGVFVDCKTGYTGTGTDLAARDEPETVCFNIFGGGLGNHIIGGEHGHMFRFANIAPGSVVSVIGGNFENFADCLYAVTNSYLHVQNPRMLLVSAAVPVCKIGNAANKVTWVNGDFGWAATAFQMFSLNDYPNYSGATCLASNALAGGAAFNLPANTNTTILAKPTEIGMLNRGRARFQNASESLQIGADSGAVGPTNTLTAATAKYGQIRFPGYAGISYDKIGIDYGDLDGTQPNIKIGGSGITPGPGPTHVSIYTSPNGTSDSIYRWGFFPDGSFIPGSQVSTIGAPSAPVSNIITRRIFATVIVNEDGSCYVTNDINGVAINATPVAGVFKVGLGVNANYFQQQTIAQSSLYKTKVTGHANYTSGDPLLFVNPVVGQTVPGFQAGSTNGATGAFTVWQGGGFLLSSNSVSQWPPAPRVHGDCYFGNSNGVLYVLTSANGITWAATNKLAP